MHGKNIWIALFICSLGSCSTMVERSHIQGIKRVGILSIYVNRRFFNAKGGGEAIPEESTRKGEDSWEQKLRLLKHASKTLTDALAQVPGWQVIGAEKILNSSAYRKALNPKGKARGLAAVLSGNEEWAKKEVISLPSMHPIPLNEAISSQRLGSLKELCGTLKLDAVALLQIDFSYSGSWWAISGHGRAVPMASIHLIVVNKRGEIAVESPLIDKAERFMADGHVWIKHGNLQLNRKAENLYRQALEKGVQDLVRSLVREMESD